MISPVRAQKAALPLSLDLSSTADLPAMIFGSNPKVSQASDLSFKIEVNDKMPETFFSIEIHGEKVEIAILDPNSETGLYGHYKEDGELRYFFLGKEASHKNDYSSEYFGLLKGDRVDGIELAYGNSISLPLNTDFKLRSIGLATLGITNKDGFLSIGSTKLVDHRKEKEEGLSVKAINLATAALSAVKARLGMGN